MPIIKSVKKRGSGRRDWSKQTELSVVGVVRSWEDRWQISGHLQSIPGWWTYISLTNNWTDISIYQFKITSENNKLIDTTLGIEDKGFVGRQVGYNTVAIDYPVGLLFKKGKEMKIYLASYGTGPRFMTRFYLSGMGRLYKL